MDVNNKYKIRLVPISSLLYGNDPTLIRSSQVAFDVTPTFSENRTAEYTPVIPVHMPGAIQVYKHTNSRTFSIGAKLISRNVADAISNMEKLQKLRGWLLPYFGSTDTTTTNQSKESTEFNGRGGESEQTQTEQEQDANVSERVKTEGIQLRGAPPDVLYLYAYSTGANDQRGAGPRININKVPVVITSLDIVYPEDVDYIPVHTPGGSPTNQTEPFPRRLDVNISLVETHSPREYEKFDLMAFKLGNLVGF